MKLLATHVGNSYRPLWLWAANKHYLFRKIPKNISFTVKQLENRSVTGSPEVAPPCWGHTPASSQGGIRLGEEVSFNQNWKNITWSWCSPQFQTTLLPAEEKFQRADDEGSCWSSRWPNQSHSHLSVFLVVFFQFVTSAWLRGVLMSVVGMFEDSLVVFPFLLEKNVVSWWGLLMSAV